MGRLIVFMCLFATPVAALDVCDDLWFTRNLIFDRAGYCFGSPLGQAVFANEDCTTSSPQLGAANAALVKRIRASEAEWECDIDTDRTSIAVEQLGFRRSLRDLPVASGYESACVGWRAAPVTLYLGTGRDSGQVGTIQAGDMVTTEFEDTGDWEFMTVYRGDSLVMMGWSDHEITPEDCDGMAG